MSTPYYPNATIPTRGNSNFALAITSTTFATPIVVTTTAAHGLSTGDCVEVAGAADIAANGTKQVIVTGTHTFTMNGSVGTMAGGAYGNVYPISVDPSFTLPVDGIDPVDASTSNAVSEGAVNTIPWLYQRTGRYRLVDRYLVENSGTSTPWVNWGGTPGSTAIALLNTPQAVSANLFAGGFGGYTNPPGLGVGDYLEISVTTDALVVSGGNLLVPAYAAQLGIGVTFAPTVTPGLEPSSVVSLSPASITEYQIGTTFVGAVTMRTFASASAVESFGVYLMANLYNVGSGAPASALTITPCGTFRCQVNHYRAN